VITGGNVAASCGTTSLSATSREFAGCTAASAPTMQLPVAAVRMAAANR
jgi:hypothetical protein